MGGPWGLHPWDPHGIPGGASGDPTHRIPMGLLGGPWRPHGDSMGPPRGPWVFTGVPWAPLGPPGGLRRAHGYRKDENNQRTDSLAFCCDVHSTLRLRFIIFDVSLCLMDLHGLKFFRFMLIVFSLKTTSFDLFLHISHI